MPRNGKFRLERCVSAERGEWAAEYEGEEALATIYHLKPSTYYKFRVRIIGSDGQISEPGKTIVFIFIYIIMFIFIVIDWI